MSHCFKGILQMTSKCLSTGYLNMRYKNSLKEEKGATKVHHWHSLFIVMKYIGRNLSLFHMLNLKSLADHKISPEHVSQKMRACKSVKVNCHNPQVITIAPFTNELVLQQHEGNWMKGCHTEKVIFMLTWRSDCVVNCLWWLACSHRVAE